MNAQQASRRLVLTSRGRVLCFSGLLAVIFGTSSGVTWLWHWGGMLLAAVSVAGLSCWRMSRNLNGQWQWSWPMNWIEDEERLLVLRYDHATCGKNIPIARTGGSMELELTGQTAITWSLQTTWDGIVTPQRVRLQARQGAVVEQARLRCFRVEPAGCVMLKQEWRWQQPGMILPRAEFHSEVMALCREATMQDVIARKWQPRDGMQQVDWRGSSRSWAQTRALMRRESPQKTAWTLVLHSHAAQRHDTTLTAWQRHLRAGLALVDRALRAGHSVTVRCPAWHDNSWRGNVLSDLPVLAQRLLLLPRATNTTWEDLLRQLNAVPVTDALWVLSDQADQDWMQRCLSLSHLRLQLAPSWQLREEENT